MRPPTRHKPTPPPIIGFSVGEIAEGGLLSADQNLQQGKRNRAGGPHAFKRLQACNARNSHVRPACHRRGCFGGRAVWCRGVLERAAPSTDLRNQDWGVGVLRLRENCTSCNSRSAQDDISQRTDDIAPGAVMRATASGKYVEAYGLTPPVWQSLQLTAVMSPRSTGCLKVTPGRAAMFTVFCCSSRMVWQSSQSLRMTLPSGLT